LGSGWTEQAGSSREPATDVSFGGIELPSGVSGVTDGSKMVIGLMSGTSVDGIDAALVRIHGCGEGLRVEMVGFATYPFPPIVRQRIFELFDPATGTVDRICEMNFVLGEAFADAAIRVTVQSGVRLEDVDLVGSHGQTVYHRPKIGREGPWVTRSTLQIAEPAVIAERTGVTTIADFRTRDIAAGGQGAPLVPYVDYLLFTDPAKSRAVQNIGGIGNVTYLPAGAVPLSVIAFDTGPGNMLIDGAMHVLTSGRLTYDKDGTWAARGTVVPSMLSELMSHPFVHTEPPKTTGREEFGLQFVRPVIDRWVQRVPQYDVVATLTAFTAESIAFAYRRFLPRVDEVILGGGGSYNPVLVRAIVERLPGTPVMRHEDFGIAGEAKEAIAFAILANEAMYGNPTNLPGATGARERVVLGKIVPGRNRHWRAAGWEW